jgi:uncharacterized protein YukE
MSQVFVNPDELRNFAQSLTSFISNINEATGSVSSSFAGLGDSWQDAQRQRFEEAFNELLQNINLFNTQVEEEHIPYINALAERADDYLHT